MKTILSVISKVLFAFLVCMIMAIGLMVIEEKILGKYFDFWNGWICAILFHTIMVYTTKSDND